jgi:hypothetical protein
MGLGGVIIGVAAMVGLGIMAVDTIGDHALVDTLDHLALVVALVALVAHVLVVVEEDAIKYTT